MKKIAEIFSVPKSNKIFISILTVVALISGALFFFKLSLDDQTLIKTYIENLIINNDYNSLITILGINFLLILVIYLFGLSVIGIFINLFIYFVKTFILSLEITAILNLLKTQGILISFINVFPHQIINLFVFAVLVIYSINLSFTFIVSIIKKENFSLSNIMKSYNKIFLVSIMIITITVLYEYFLLPIILKLVLN